MALVQNQLKKWGHLKELNACAAARVSANAVKVSSVQTVWRHLMVLKKQNGMQRGRAVILAACICTGWLRFSGCLLGGGKVGKKRQSKCFGPLFPLGAFPVGPARHSALGCFQCPAAGQGEEGSPCRGRLGCGSL